MTEDQSGGTSQNTGRSRIRIPFSKVEAKPWPGRLLVVVAAFLLVAVGVVSIGMKLIGSDDDEPTATEAAGPTGFYLPGDLPAGWKVTGIGDFQSGGGLEPVSPFIACPCSFTEVDRRGSDRYTTIDSVGGPEQLGKPNAEHLALDDPVTSDDNRAAWYEEVRGVRMVVWRTAVGSRAVASTSLDRGALEALAKAWTSDKPPVLGGHRVTDSWTVDHPITRGNAADWNLDNEATGQSMTVSIRPNMLWYSLLLGSSALLPGNGLHAGLLPGTQDVVAVGRGHTELLASSYPDDGTAPLDPATLLAILGTFKPVDAVTWGEYWTSMSMDLYQNVLEEDDPLRTDRITDWLEGSKPDAELSQRLMEIIQSDPDDPSATITVESTIDQFALVAGEQLTIGLTMTNDAGASRDVSGCSFGSATWSIIDEQGFMTPAGAMDVFCDEGLQPWPGGEQRRQTFDFPGEGQPTPGEGPVAAVIDFGHTTVVIPGRVGL